MLATRSVVRSVALPFLAFGIGALTLLQCNGSTSEAPVATVNDGGTDASASDAGAPSANDASPDAWLVLGDDASPDADGSLVAQCTGKPSQPVARPTCTATSAPLPPGDPSASPTCTTVADCAEAGIEYTACLAGTCSIDQCLTDTDCPTGEACGCATEFGGNIFHVNRCLAAQCRTSADCASGGACSPSNGSYCNSVTGFYCHSPADECATDTDCACDVPGYGAEPAQCAFAPQLGHFVCQVLAVCVG